MRVIGGMDHTKPDHWRHHFRDCPTITVDGELVDHVSEADDAAGYVIVVCYRVDGLLQVDESGEQIQTRRIDGRVEILGERFT